MSDEDKSRVTNTTASVDQLGSGMPDPGRVRVGCRRVDATVEPLFWIVLVSVIAPLVAGLVPRRLVPEVVLLLVLGVVIGPYATGLASVDGSVELLRELGLAMLFLLAGFEIVLRELSRDRRADPRRARPACLPRLAHPRPAAVRAPGEPGIGLFAATGLPIIVAVTTVSVDAGQMTLENASLLVTAGAATVLLCPLLATLVLQRDDGAGVSRPAAVPDPPGGP